MATIKLTLQYDGTDFGGWQLQPNARTVQAVVEQGLDGLLGEAVRLHSSGRTDAGVHARGMVAHFTTGRELPLSAYREGLNALLPADVAVIRAEAVADDFHARFSATGKWYRYTLLRSPVRHPLHDRYALQLRADLDLAAMRRAAQALVGEHDFAAFRSSSCEAATSVRRVTAIDLLEQDQLLHIDVRGGGFLKNMVRIIVGTLLEVGQGKRSVASVAELLASKDRTLAGKTVAGKGLCLMEVYYDGEALQGAARD